MSEYRLIDETFIPSQEQTRVFELYDEVVYIGEEKRTTYYLPMKSCVGRIIKIGNGKFQVHFKVGISNVVRVCEPHEIKINGI